MTHSPPKTSNVPLAVWPCAQRSRQPASGAGEISPALARRAIDAYSDPGDLVVDPNCRTGTVPAEAIRLDRDALGITPCLPAAAARVELARSNGAPGRARVLVGDGRDLLRLLARNLREQQREQPVARLPHASADLILTALPPRRHGTLEPFLEPLATVVKPAGFVVLALGARRSGTALTGEVVALCQRIGLLYWQHVIALTAEIRGDQLAPACGRRAHSPRRSRLACHQDVLVFRRPPKEKP